jgi:hypothetical protein
MVRNRMNSWYDIGIWHFKLVPLLAGLSVGALVAYVYKPERQIIHQYPHPSDSNAKVFKDHNGICYTYTSHEVNCDANEATLIDYPVQG